MYVQGETYRVRQIHSNSRETIVGAINMQQVTQQMIDGYIFLSLMVRYYLIIKPKILISL